MGRHHQQQKKDPDIGGRPGFGRGRDDGTALQDLKFVSEMEVEIDEGLSVTLPFKYLIIDNKVQISPKIVELLREQEGF